jgi:hypothetical protein
MVSLAMGMWVLTNHSRHSRTLQKGREEKRAAEFFTSF